jgi:branched-chain amino acid transport system ATP-binding protein
MARTNDVRMLSVRRLSKDFGGLAAVRDLSFEVAKGEIVGLIGPNGAGKTTTFNLISGFITPTSGEVLFEGRPVQNLKPHRICQLGLARTFQITQPFPDITTLENVLIGAYNRHASPAAAHQKAHDALERMKLSHKARERAKNLTLIELKQLEIAKALATEPRMLLLDEVAAGLNAAEIDEILELVRELNGQGITLLVVEHIMRVIMSLSQRIVVLNFGVKIAEGSPDEISRDPRVLDAYLGEEGGRA